MSDKSDPISAKYFKPIEKAEDASDLLFYVTALVSLVVLFIDKVGHQTFYTLAQVVFGILAITGVLLGLAIKLYWAPRGTEKRIADFVSSAFGVNLTPERTRGYYNNDATDPVRRAGMQLLENCFFTKEVVRMMCVRRRIIVAAYTALWLGVMVNRDFSIDFVLIAIQVVFSEQIISSVVRLEWLRAKSERIFDAMYRHMSAKPLAEEVISAIVVEHLVRYESIKAASNVTTSSKIFNANNERLSAEWDRIRLPLGS